MTKRMLVAALVALASIAVPATASARTTTCRMPRDIRSAFPAVDRVQTRNLPRRTDGHASRCLVARTVVRILQRRQHNGHLPRHVHPRGAHWNGGVWRVRKRVIRDGDVVFARITVTRGRRTLRFNGYS